MLIYVLIKACKVLTKYQVKEALHLPTKLNAIKMTKNRHPDMFCLIILQPDHLSKI